MNNIEISRTDGRTRFIPKNVNKNFINNLIKNDEISYNKYDNEIKQSDIKIGLEFEFYLNKDTNIEKLFSSILSFGKELVFLPEEYNTQDKDLSSWTIERDGTLMSPISKGYEIVSPKLDLHEVPFYMKKLLHIIREYGYTDKTCGLHFHISSENKNIQNIDPSKLMLFLEEKDTLSLWKYRTDTNREISDIFKKATLEDFNKNFKNISRFHSIVSRSTYGIQNHLEVRAIGGKDYEYKLTHIMKDFKEVVESFYVACNPLKENEKYIDLRNHFLKTCERRKSINFEDLLRKAKETCESNSITFDRLNPHDRRDMIETAIYNFEDNGEFVPIKTLLKELDVFIEKENNANSHCEFDNKESFLLAQ